MNTTNQNNNVTAAPPSPSLPAIQLGASSTSWSPSRPTRTSAPIPAAPWRVRSSWPSASLPALSSPAPPLLASPARTPTPPRRPLPSRWPHRSEIPGSGWGFFSAREPCPPIPNARSLPLTQGVFARKRVERDLARRQSGGHLHSHPAQNRHRNPRYGPSRSIKGLLAAQTLFSTKCQVARFRDSDTRALGPCV